jgi:hypothetical protein
MSVLENFPLISQLTQVTSDGRPNENAMLDYMATSVCAATMHLIGRNIHD